MLKLTIGENPERLKRFSHIQPAPAWGKARCADVCPGTTKTCTLEKGHRGPHVAHGRFRKVVAAWDADAVAETTAQISKGRGRGVQRQGLPVRGPKPPGRGEKKDLPAWLHLGRRLIRRAPDLEEVLLIVMGTAMAGFALHWAGMIIGWW